MSESIPAKESTLRETDAIAGSPKKGAAVKGDMAAHGLGDSATAPVTAARQPAVARETGGPEGPEPTRFGDWERKGRCIDF